MTGLKGIAAAAMAFVSLLTPGLKYSFNPAKFVLPDTAKMLVVVEGTGGTNCRVYAFEKENNMWAARIAVDGFLGKNGMNNYRHEGDKTTPIGVWMMNTPFGQKPAKEGFPKNYIQVDTSYTWTDDTNKLVKDPSLKGEHVGRPEYAEYYDYVIDAGYNKNGVAKKGSALFLHCGVKGDTETSGCVQIATDAMIEVMKLYGKYGDGACFIAQCPQGKFDMLYDSYGKFNGLSPDGDFGK